MLLSPEMLRNSLLHQGLLSWLTEHNVDLGGNDDMRSVKRVAATLCPSGDDKVAAVSILDGIEARFMRLCRFGDAPVTAGWPSGSERLAAQPSSGRLTPQSVDGAAASDSEQQPLHPSLAHGVRYGAEGNVFGAELP